MTTDPYRALGEQVFAAASRQQNLPHRAPRRRSLSPRARVVFVTLVLLLAGAAIALASSGLLSGSAVKPSGLLNPRRAEGIPAPGGSRLLALRVPDPQGGPPWGLRIVRTTREEVCLQVGRVSNGQLGELGIDGAFGDDGRFHPLAPDVLPADGPDSYDAACILTSQITTDRIANLDRNAAKTRSGTSEPSADLREISFGLLGPHALSITYRSSGGMRTQSMRTGAGAYLIVGPAKAQSTEATGATGYASLTKFRPSPLGAVSAITYRFGNLICFDGTGPRELERCPVKNSPPASSIAPTRSLRMPLHLTLHRRRDGTYAVEVAFTAPYAVDSAHELYEVIDRSPAGCGSAGGSGLPLERDISRGQKVHVESIATFSPAGRCGSVREIQVRFINPEGPSGGSAHESVIIGSATVTGPPQALKRRA